MKLFILEYIENLLKKAQYEYDPATSSWCAYVHDLPGAYAQSDSVEEAREKLTEVIEDYILISLQKGDALPQFGKSFITTDHKREYA
ncbi:MAG: hypothetical protein UW39_C0016G0028 [Parcubacteria group bacterium GW2011_GWC2_44_17]|uniref:Uncharacterized protein n=1 Tax=Candidatus Jacksonbacteria bacterium RIFCSPLOWO2_02_FULL_44_20 TaxID=1798460 RepID=A0A1G2A9G2_9BACT|nr:MAG: hypothetical protein UW39_C0016G0028 [Parcubacteria group bacterium GW2011_GWC2_44_17]KKT48781.1 MAG: hypothetical protein UW40_C0033G0010 [Parcubacteria group bacterium GW2011_GWF2_44_17]OGY71098.1 MAG: hypothetical protein A3E05_00340 [Candidatus Jacksonbacteria bacterium RIFCSPHIGHO2_12_FULL_44_12]OGY71489.1 MAG: hypothetical protein A3C00_00710 [Candidatus Jacksonbacteria bacterium RIFCSPHIGHO2_02_FULL_44_25]OGY73289.1 MAG: hypothetical protein A3H61_00970 [Candidatus Jacksonbacteri